MKSGLNPKTDPGAIDTILGDEEELIPSSGFLAATMDRVREEAAMPKPIPFPWLRALPGIVLAVAVLGWCGFELARVVLANPREVSFAQLHLAAATGRALEPAGWVVLALAVSAFSWLFARRLAGRSGLL
ncbi:MAG: hypothetical protein WCF30_01670 [Terracidiphilus sp.]